MSVNLFLFTRLYVCCILQKINKMFHNNYCKITKILHNDAILKRKIVTIILSYIGYYHFHLKASGHNHSMSNFEK